MSSKIIIAGGTGALGTLLSKAYSELGWEVVVLGRSESPMLRKARYIRWDGRSLGDWAGELDSATAILNLAGRPVDTRFTAKNKREILQSRVLTTTVIGEAIARCPTPPEVWINAGGISIFEPSSVLINENDVPDGMGFLAWVSRQWEASFADADTPTTRKVQLRMGSVLLSKGGMLAPLVKLAKLGLGGTVGPGNQYVSWIHEGDFVKLIDWLVARKSIMGVIHACSPNPVKNETFMRALRKRINAPIGLPTPTWMVRWGARLIGTEPQLALDGHRVTSKVLRDAGFQFDYPDVGHALDNLML
ncbi:TIGR01777 family oxidoreductase [Parapedobacter sp.]